MTRRRSATCRDVNNRSIVAAGSPVLSARPIGSSNRSGMSRDLALEELPETESSLLIAAPYEAERSAGVFRDRIATRSGQTLTTRGISSNLDDLAEIVTPFVCAFPPGARMPISSLEDSDGDFDFVSCRFETPSFVLGNRELGVELVGTCPNIPYIISATAL